MSLAEEDTQSWGGALGIILYQIPIIISIGMTLEGGGTCPWCPPASATYACDWNTQIWSALLFFNAGDEPSCSYFKPCHTKPYTQPNPRPFHMTNFSCFNHSETTFKMSYGIVAGDMGITVTVFHTKRVEFEKRPKFLIS